MNKSFIDGVAATLLTVSLTVGVWSHFSPESGAWAFLLLPLFGWIGIRVMMYFEK